MNQILHPMKHSMMIKVLTSMLIILSVAGCQPKQPESSEESSEKTPLQKFQEMKFGMFIHWGLYAVPAGEWEGEYVRGIGEWIMHSRKIPVTEYEKLTEQFNPVKFNADEWSQLAEDTGMKYMVITAKHHDGFAMYHSKVSDYNIIDRTPFKRDPMKELAEANKKRNIKFGFYYSQTHDWHEPNAEGNTWDFPEERDQAPYIESKALPQVEELLENYGNLAFMWFDTPRFPKHLTREQALSIKQQIKEKQPNCLVNERIGYDLGDYDQMGDNAIPTFVYDWNVWEIPATLNDTWGYKRLDNNWKDSKDLIYKLADIVRKGGNYLLNVGPTAEGVIPEESQKILRTMGAWLEVNGVSIYGAGHTPFFNTDIIWKCTTKPGKLYFHILNWPGTNLEIAGLESRVKSAKFLKNGQKVTFTQTDHMLSFSLPEQPLDRYNTVIVADIEDEEPVITAGMRYDDPQDLFILHSHDARISGEGNRYDWNSQSVSGYNRPENELWWYHFPHKTDTFHIRIEYACEDQIAGSTFHLYKNVRWDPSKNQELKGIIQGTGGAFKTFDVGEMFFDEAEFQIIAFGLGGDISSDVKVRKIILERTID